MRRKRRKRCGRIRRRRGFRGTRFKNASRSGSRGTKNPQRRATTNTAIGLRTRRSLFALVVRDDDARVVVYLSTLRRSNPIIPVHFSPPKCIKLWYVSFRFYPVFFFLNAEQRERNNHRFLITSAFKLLLLFKLLRVESLFCSRSLMKPIRIPREESNPLENVSNSLSYLVSLIPYEKALSSLSCFFLSLLSRALLRRITAFRRLYCCCCCCYS